MKTGITIIVGFSLLLMSAGTIAGQSCSANCSGGSCSISLGENEVRGILGPDEPAFSNTINSIGYDGGSILLGATDQQRQAALNEFAGVVARHAETIVEAADDDGLELVIAIEQAHAQGDWPGMHRLHSQLRRLATSHGLDWLSDALKEQLLGGVECGCSRSGEPYCNKL